MASKQFLTKQYFALDFLGKACECEVFEGGGVTFEVVQTTPSSRQHNRQEHTVGRPIYDPITFRRKYVKGRDDWRKWVEEFAEGKRTLNPTEAASVIIQHRDGQEARRMNLFGLLPLKYESGSADAGAGDFQMESLSIQVQRIEYKSS